MSYPFPPELSQLVQESMSAGNFGSEDELLILALRVYQVNEKRRIELSAELNRRLASVGSPASRSFDRDEFLAAMQKKTGELS